MTELMEVRVAVLEAQHKALAMHVREGLDLIRSELHFFRNTFIAGVLLVIAGGVLDRVIS